MPTTTQLLSHEVALASFLTFLLATDLGLFCYYTYMKKFGGSFLRLFYTCNCVHTRNLFVDCFDCLLACLFACSFVRGPESADAQLCEAAPYPTTGVPISQVSPNEPLTPSSLGCKHPPTNSDANGAPA